MKSLLVTIICVVAAMLSGCATSKNALYYSVDNWVIRDNAVPRYYAIYDVFYVYPSMVENPEVTYINWTKDNINETILNYARSQTSDIFDTTLNIRIKAENKAKIKDIGSRVRIFCPYVHQLEHGKYIETIKRADYASRKSPLRNGINDTLKALEHYFKYYHKKGRPFILVGQEQGAVDLYEAMKRCSKVKPSNGFVAAYFTGLPHTSKQKIYDDFHRRGISAGVGEFDTGVILAWNARTGHAVKPLLTSVNDYVINPINWRTDGAVAKKEDDKGTLFYDYLAPNEINLEDEKKPDTAVPVDNLCDAYIDNGVLLVNEEQIRDAFPHVILGEGVFHSHMDSMFNKNVVYNAEQRVLQYLYKQRWNKANVSKDE